MTEHQEKVLNALHKLRETTLFTSLRLYGRNYMPEMFLLAVPGEYTPAVVTDSQYRKMPVMMTRRKPSWALVKVLTGHGYQTKRYPDYLLISWSNQ